MDMTRILNESTAVEFWLLGRISWRQLLWTTEMERMIDWSLAV